MPALKVTLTVEKDGIKVLEKIRRLAVDEAQTFQHEQAGHADATTFTAVPADQLAEIQVLVVESDSQVTLRLDGQTDAGIVINAGGLILLFDVDIDAGAGADNAKINHNAAATVLALLSGIAGGT